MPLRALLLLLALLAHDHAGRPCRWRMDRPAGEGIKLRWHLAARFDLPGVPRDEARAAARLAWADWSAVAGVEAVEVDTIGEANVEVRAAVVDGPGGEAGRAAYPCHAGRDHRVHVRLDRSEPWDAARLRKVLRHEIGHILGIDDDGPGSWMAERVDWMSDEPSWWDRAEAQARYGPPSEIGDAPARIGAGDAYLGPMPGLPRRNHPDRLRVIVWRSFAGKARDFGGLHVLPPA